MKPILKVIERDAEILIADSGRAFFDHDTKAMIYRTGYALWRGEVKIGNYNDYPVSDFFAYTPLSGQQKRVDEAIRNARESLSTILNTGYFDPDKRGLYSHQSH